MPKTFLRALMGFFLINVVIAQRIPESPPVFVAASEEVTELSPFVVTSDRDVGYTASNTLAGSRLNTALKDTPASISVLTPEFLEDIGAFDLEDAMGYAVNVELQLEDDRQAISDNETTEYHQRYRVRGINASMARNYFSWEIPTETAFIERIEESRGPNAVLFGIASAGGLINANTKQPRAGRSFQKGSFTVFDRDSYRATIDLNQSLLGGKLAVRFNGVYKTQNGDRYYEFVEHKGGHIAVSYRLTDRTRLRAEFEHGQLDDNKPKGYNLSESLHVWNSNGRPTFSSIPTAAQRSANNLTLYSNAANTPRVTYIANLDMAISMRGQVETNGSGNVLRDPTLTNKRINAGGPGHDRSTRFNALSGFIEHRFSPTMFLELAYNHQDSAFDRFDARQASNELHGDPLQFLPNGAPNPNVGRLFLETNWVRLHSKSASDTGRAMLSKEFDFGKWGNYRLAGMGDYEKSYYYHAVYGERWLDATTGLGAFNTGSPENAQNNVWRRRYVNEGDWADYYNEPHNGHTLLQSMTDPITGRTLNAAWVTMNAGSPSETYSTRKAQMVAGQARFFRGRLLLAGGLRRDTLDEYLQARMRDPATNQFVMARNPDDAPGSSRWDKFSGRTMTGGLVYHLTPKVSLYFNKADNISLPARRQTALGPEGLPGKENLVAVEPPQGKGMDVGVGVSLFDGKIYTRVTYYETSGERQSSTAPVQPRNANQRIVDALQAAGLLTPAEYEYRSALGSHGLFDHETRGVEAQVTTNITKNWRLQANYALTKGEESNRMTEWLAWDAQNVAWLQELDARFPSVSVFDIMTSARSIRADLDFMRSTNNGLYESTADFGGNKYGNRRHKVSLFTRYDLPFEKLRGAYIGGGYRHQSKMFAGFNTAGENQYTNSYWYADALAGYKFRKLFGMRMVGLQLNVTNVFNNREPLVLRLRPDGQSVFRQVIPRPLTWKLTTNIDF